MFSSRGIPGSRYTLFPWFMLWVLALAITLQAGQEKYAVGTTVDVVSGGTNNLNSVVATSTDRPFALFYAHYPTLNLAATGAHSNLGFSYGFGLNRSVNQQNIHSTSHQASVSFAKSLKSKWKVTFGGSFQLTSDAATFNALRGIAAVPQPSSFLINSTAVNRLTRSGEADVGVDYSLSNKSSISVSGSYGLQSYGGALPAQGLSNQQRYSGSVTYNRRTSKTDTWSVGYNGGYYTFRAFASVASQSLRLGYSDQVRPDLTFSLSVGASQSRNYGSGAGYIGYNTSASLAKTTKTNSFSIHYNQDSGQPTGLGSVSNTRRAGIGVNQVGRTTSAFVDVSVFDSVGILGNDLGIRGAAATGNVGIFLTRKLSVQFGGEYQRTNQTQLLGFTQKRLFVSVRYSDPKLWQFTH